MQTLQCSLCKQLYPENTPQWRCACEGPFALELDHSEFFQPDNLAKRPKTLWRYREALPIENDNSIVSLGEGATPTMPTKLWGIELLLKQEQLFPTGSFKDRGSTVLISKVKDLGLKHVVEDSSGNAGASIAAYCAQSQIQCDILVPQATSPAKLVQILAYGAKLEKIPGSRQATADAALKRAKDTYYASHSWNPFFFHGTKTVAFEIWEDLGFKSPDTVVLPVGNGTLFLGAYLGFVELRQAGYIDKLPKLIGVQTAQCAPLYEKLYQKPSLDSPKSTSNLAEGIAIAKPIRETEILQAVKQSQGALIAVTEQEIKDALIHLCTNGFFVEPTCAATIAGVRKFAEGHDTNETLVSVLSGHGLKSSDKIGKLIGLL